jgi:hypothetical protein
MSTTAAQVLGGLLGGSATVALARVVGVMVSNDLTPLPQDENCVLCVEKGERYMVQNERDPLTV